MATRFDPFADLQQLAGQFWGNPRDAALSPGQLSMDLYRAGDHFVAHIDLPGVDPESIDVGVEEGTLTVRAERTARTDEDAQWLVRERPTGTFARRLVLGRGLALDGIDATYADGVLTVTIPVAEEAKPRRISVQHGSSATAIDAQLADSAN